MRQLQREALQEAEDPDRVYADAVAEEDENLGKKRKGGGKGRGRGRARGRGRGKGKGKSEEGKDGNPGGNLHQEEAKDSDNNTHDEERKHNDAAAGSSDQANEKECPEVEEPKDTESTQEAKPGTPKSTPKKLRRTKSKRRALLQKAKSSTPESDKKRALKNKDKANKEEDKPEAVPANEPEQHVKQPRKKRKSQKDASEHAANEEKNKDDVDVAAPGPDTEPVIADKGPSVKGKKDVAKDKETTKPEADEVARQEQEAKQKKIFEARMCTWHEDHTHHIMYLLNSMLL